jgi:alpha-ketoglutaric semialdehyde dehydrogenase
MNFKPELILNWINGKECTTTYRFSNFNPHNSNILQEVSLSYADDVNDSVKAAIEAQPNWREVTPVIRGEYLRTLTQKMEEYREQLADILHLETGKSKKDALSEVGVAIEQGYYWAGEGRRFASRTLTTAASNRTSFVTLDPVGVAGLIVPANTPIANIAWKVFPALLCGNSIVLKSAEDSPWIAWVIAQLASETDIPVGVLNVIHGKKETGKALVAHPEVGVISFTGSTFAGQQIAEVCGHRLARVSLELGGKNPLVVCDDSDLNLALHWSLLSSFSNAGQRCAASSRIIVMDSIYEKFKKSFVEKTKALKLGVEDSDDLGPVINENQLEQMLSAVHESVGRGSKLLTGGKRADEERLRKGCYMLPTILEQIGQEDPISKLELFGPVTCLYRVKTFDEALRLADDSPYGLTAAIHTRSLDRSLVFAKRMRSGVVNVNGGTHGSEPHMPFGGTKASGNGSREPGLEAIDIYTEKKNIHLNFFPN